MTTRKHHQAVGPAIDQSRLRTLDRDLRRCRARAHRLWRDYQAIDEKRNPGASASAHQAWSDAVDDALKIAEAVSREQAGDLGDLLTQFEAIWWWVIEDDSVLDTGTRHWLRRFRRSLRHLAAQN